MFHGLREGSVIFELNNLPHIALAPSTLEQVDDDYGSLSSRNPLNEQARS